MAADAHDGAQFAGDNIHRIGAASGIDVNVHGGVRAVRLEKSGERNAHPVVHAGTHHFALAFGNANHRIGSAVDANLFAERVAGPEHIFNDVGADNGHVSAVLVLEFGEGSADLDVEIGQSGHGPGNAADVCVRGGPGLVDDSADGGAVCADGQAGLALRKNGPVVVECNISPLLEFQILVNSHEGFRH